MPLRSLKGLLVVGFLVCLGCTYSGTLRGSFYQGSSRTAERLPLKVAVIADPIIQQQQFRAAGQGYSVKIRVYPGLVGAVAAELRTVFDTVDILDEPELAKDHDLTAYVRFGASELDRQENPTVRYVFKTEVSVVLKDHFGREVARSAHAGQLIYTSPTDAQVSSFLTVFSLFVLSPITVPYTTAAVGRHTKDLLVESVSELLPRVAFDLRQSPGVMAYMRDYGLGAERPIGPMVANQPNAVDMDGKFQTLVETLLRDIKRYPVSRVAVLPADFVAGDGIRPLGQYIADKIIAKVHDSGTLAVVERAALKKILQEMAISHTGPFDDTSAVRIGKLVGADALIESSYAEVAQQQIEVTSKLIRSETGEILGVGAIRIPHAVVRQLLYPMDPR